MIKEAILAVSLCASMVYPGTVPQSPPCEVSQQIEVPLFCWEEIPLDDEVQDYIVRRCVELDISPSVVFAMIFKESTYNADAIGDGGKAYGLMQIHPRWHGERIEELGCDNLLDPLQNVTVGLHYLEELLDRYGSLEAALVAYNRGSYSGQVTSYAKAVMNEARRIEEDVLHR